MLCRSSCHEDRNSFIGKNSVFSHALALFWRNVESCALSWWEMNVHSSTVQPWFVTCANSEDVDDYFNLLFMVSSYLCLVLRDEISCVCAKNWRNPNIYCESPMPLFVTYPNMHVTSFFLMSCVFTRIKSFDMNDTTLKGVFAKKSAPRLAESI